MQSVVVFKRIVELEKHYMVDDYIKSERDFIEKEKYMSYLDTEELEATRRLNAKCNTCKNLKAMINSEECKNSKKHIYGLIRRNYPDKTVCSIREIRLNYCPECGKRVE